MYEEDSPEIGGDETHVFLELGDHLGSTSVVIDKATSELVERSTTYAYGATESDYRPERWNFFREDYRFTGKEEDVEVGLQYFGKRFYAPMLQRWISPDPLTVHGLGADPNLYAYVSGKALQTVDPLGLCEGQAGCTGENGSYALDEVTIEGSAAPLELSDEQLISNANLEEAFRLADTGDLQGAARTLSGESAAPEPQVGGDMAAAFVNGGLSILSFDWAMENRLAETPLAGGTAQDVEYGVQLGLYAFSVFTEALAVTRVALTMPTMLQRSRTTFATSAEVTVSTRLPTMQEGLEVADALAWELQAELATLRGGYGVKPPVVIGRFDPVASEAGAFASRAGLAGHAEDVAKEAMPTGLFSRPVNVRRGEYNWVCPTCERKYGRGAFPQGTIFESDISSGF